MPKVGKKYFKYDKAGRSKAAKYSKATGKKVVDRGKKGKRKAY